MTVYGQSVNDPSLLEELNSENSVAPQYGASVTDPKLLADLNGSSVSNTPSVSQNLIKQVNDATQQPTGLYDRANYLANPMQDPNFSNLNQQQQLQRLSLAANSPDNVNFVSPGFNPFSGSAKTLADIGTNALSLAAPELKVGGPIANTLIGGPLRIAGNTGINAILGASNAPDNMVGGAEAGGLAGLTGNVIGRGASTAADLGLPVSSKGLSQVIQSDHDALAASAANGFNNTTNQVIARGVDQVPSKYIDSGLIDQIRDNKYLPNTPEQRSLLNAAESGDFSSLRQLQTSLWQKGTKAAASPDPAINNKAEEMFDTRDQINDGIESHLRDSGNDDLADQLNKSMSDYANLKQTYFSHPTIANMVDPEKQIVPDNLLNILSEDSKRMDRLRASNPVIQNAVDKTQNQKLALKVGSRGLGTAAALGAAYHFLKPTNPLSGNLANQAG
jgi:hypothetical protein